MYVHVHVHVVHVAVPTWKLSRSQAVSLVPRFPDWSEYTPKVYAQTYMCSLACPVLREATMYRPIVYGAHTKDMCVCMCACICMFVHGRTYVYVCM